jgi:hypothetical protein
MTDAYRAFRMLDGRKVAGEVVRVNFVNGVRFESTYNTAKGSGGNVINADKDADVMGVDAGEE